MKTYLWQVSLFSLLVANKVVSVEIGKFIADSTEFNECTIFNEKYFKLIEQFYGSINLISLYFIHPNLPNGSQFDLSSILLEQIPKSKIFLCSLVHKFNTNKPF